MRVATYNIRNGRALDPASLWWTRRHALADAIAAVDADIWGLQEVYGFQRTYLERVALSASDWGSVGVGRNQGGGGEQVPLYCRRSVVVADADTTRWFGPTPELAGSVMAGASRPRIASEMRVRTLAGDRVVRVVNLHLDSDSVDRRAESIRQLAVWLEADGPGTPTIVMGDFNGPMTEPGYEALSAIGLRSALDNGSGPTSNGFGRHLADQAQIDHLLVSAHFEVVAARIAVEAGHASDHYPVVVDLEMVAS